MIRELKFRAWDGEKMRVDFTIDAEDGMIGRGVQVIRDWHIMQFTGLKDKNGADIYEGDIVNVSDRHNGDIYVVQYDPIKAFNPFHEPYDYDLNYPYYEQKDIEIIGNIYQNKNLLEQ